MNGSHWFDSSLSDSDCLSEMVFHTKYIFPRYFADGRIVEFSWKLLFSTKRGSNPLISFRCLQQSYKDNKILGKKIFKWFKSINF